jgi:hypothetical protein
VGQINSREVVLLASQVITTSGTSADINVPMGWQAATISLQGSTITGTVPTFNFVVQKKLGQAAATDLVGNPPTGTAIYDDVLAFGQVTSSSAVRISNLCTGPQSPTANSSVVTTADWLQSDGVLTAGDVRVGPLGPLWRMKWVVSGTTPSGTFFVTAQLIPFST